MSTLTQRWRETFGSNRIGGEPIDTSRYTVERISLAEAKHFVVQHHYSKTLPQVRFGFGLIEHALDSNDTELVGVLTLGNGTRAATLANAFPGLISYRESVELNRLVLLDRIAANAESWFVSRALRSAAEYDIRGVTTFPTRANSGKPRLRVGTCWSNAGMSGWSIKP